MLKGTIIALGLCFAAAPAFADTTKRLNAEVVEVQQHRNPAGTILGDTVAGAAAGALVGGGVVLYDHYVTNSGNGGWGNWGRTVAIGAGIGAAVGLVFGLVDAGSSADRAPNGALVDERPSGMGASTPVYGLRF